MDHIIIDQLRDSEFVLDLTALYECLENVPDLRCARGRRYQLAYVLLVIVLAKLSGVTKPFAIAEWAKERAEALATMFQQKRLTAPALNTIRRLMSPDQLAGALHTVLGQFLYQQYGGQQSILVTLDGKTLRGTIPAGKTQGVHVLAAFLPAEGIVLAQVRVDNKANEITAAPEVIALVDLRGRVMSGDAAFTQRALSVQVLSQGGDYLWFVKGNQPTLKADVERFFTPSPQAEPRSTLTVETATNVRLQRGRCERRTLSAIVDKNNYIDWPGLHQVFKLERQVTVGTTTSVETAYGITSLSPDKAGPELLLAWTQAHWGIENGLHYRRDVTLAEDATRMCTPTMALSLSVLHNFIIGLACKLGFTNLASAQRAFDARFSRCLAAFY